MTLPDFEDLQADHVTAFIEIDDEFRPQFFRFYYAGVSQQLAEDSVATLMDAPVGVPALN